MSQSESREMSTEHPDRVGLCAGCVHARLVSTPRSGFWLCGRSRTDTSYDRYPRLPMLACRGFEPGEPAADNPAGVDEGGKDEK